MKEDKQNFARSLFWRVGLSFLLILLLVGLAYVLITTFASQRYYEETTQRLNAHVAESMLQEVDPFVQGKVNEKALGKIMHSMMAVNPSPEVYLLDPKGSILSYVVLDKKVKLKHVDIKPIKEFIHTNGSEYILGDDPRNPGEETIFSATAVHKNDRLMGYVYMVLLSEQTDNIASALLSSYWLKVGTRTFVVTLIAAFLIGLILIWYLTKNLSIVAQTFKRFEKGNLQARIPEKKMKGELSGLASTFNNMADTILNNIDELKEVDSLRRELIANISHDLRSPLAVIHGYIETLMIREHKINPEERKKYLETILSSSERLQKLVTDLFELSKLEARQVKLKKESFLINELLQDAAQHYKLLAEKKNIRISSKLSKAIPLVKADISLMERVVQNLLSNAIRYTPENGEVELNVEHQDQQVKVEIKNTGQSIPRDEIPHLFDRYYKIKKANSAVEGSGLGLAIVKKILDLHEIPIHVKSIAGKFTSFSFLIPLSS